MSVNALGNCVLACTVPFFKSRYDRRIVFAKILVLGS